MSTTATILERHEFKAETKEVLDLMIHSLYSNKDIFLRELISNASDAIDKLKFEALTDTSLNASDIEHHILLEADSKARTLTIQDTGIGMSKDDLVNLLGTIAKSGTREFIEALKEKQKEDTLASPELIGQFGVGFYSSFIVADKVELITRKAGQDKATRWESTGDGSYTLEEAERSNPGTTITLHLKSEDTEDGLQDYTKEWTIRQIVKQYSDFVAYPIQMDIERTEIERDSEGKPIEGGKETKKIERQTLNSMKAIWAKPESEVTDEECKEFYKHISHDWSDPLTWFRTKMEGTFEAQALLYIPSKAPMDILYRSNSKRGVHLYVKRVFIMDDCKDLMPEYLRFVKGVVDSEDLSLNVSREILQQDRQIRAIRKRLVKKVFSTLRDLINIDRKQYLNFWKEFGRVLKEGLYDDIENQEALLDLVLFESTHSETELTTLREYMGRMKAEQQEIYFLTGDSRSTVENSPHLESFKAKGYEVLILTDPVDELWGQAVTEFQETPLKSVGKGTVELGTEAEKEEATKALEEKETEYRSLLDTIKTQLDKHVKEVRLSNRLTESPACLVGNPSDMTPQMEQLLKAMNQEVPENKRILELNPDHPIVGKLQSVYTENNEDKIVEDLSYLLYGQALLAEGSAVPEPGKFNKLMSELMVKAIQ